MKKILILLIFSFSLFANPIAIPQAIISELYFTPEGDWILELGIFGESYHEGMFDSVFIASTSGKAKIKPRVFKEDAFFFLVNSDSLCTPLSINPVGDCIKVITYETYGYEAMIDSLRFGNYPGSHIPEIMKGYSICRLYDLFVRDKNPTLGWYNDTTGTCATLQGFMNDINNQPIKEGDFQLDSDLYFDKEGRFRTRVYSLNYGKFYISEKLSGPGSKNYKIDTLKINIEPDSTYNQNIHLLSEYVVGIHETSQKPDEELLLISYPNPFNATITFKVKWPGYLVNIEKRILIFDITGKLINSIKLDNRHTITWDGRDQQGYVIASGMYFYKLVADNIVFKSGSIVLLK
jgi:hypothetical protein